jgi:hypothetical protein
LSSENKDSNTNPPTVQQPTDNSYYQRKKNWISGVDNDMVLGLGVAAATTIASIAAFPMIKDAWEKFVNRPPPPPVVAPQPAIEEYIPPTPPLPQPNGHATEQETPPPPVVEPPKEEEEDGLFHETELRRRQKLMGQKQRGSRYDSPFGKDIGGL